MTQIISYSGGVDAQQRGSKVITSVDWNSSNVGGMWVAADHTAVEQYRHRSLTPYMALERCEAVSKQSANIRHSPRQSHCSIQYKLCKDLLELVVHTGDHH